MINRLGNLTLLAKALNISVRNKPFVDKKPKYLESDLMLTKELDAFNDWSVESIDQRQAALSQYAPEIWRFPAE